jgi:hypothetical protein
MITYAKVIDGKVVQWPYGVGQMRQENPNISFPSAAFTDESIRERFDVVVVQDAEALPPPGWKAVQVGPVLENGVWTQKWDYVMKEADELLPHDFANPEPPSDADLKDEHGVIIKLRAEGPHKKVGDTWEHDWTGVELGWKDKRLNAYGWPASQIEFITENGLEAWQAKVAEIKARYPKE